MRTILIILLLVTSLSAINAQSNQRVHMIAQSGIDSVQLRWAPSSPFIWNQITESGVYLIRQTVMRDGKLIPLSERQQETVLTQEALRPATEEAFGQIGATDQYVAIGGQALYGENFLTTSNDPQLGGLINAAQEQENRFSFGLFAADQSWQAAKMMALGFVDYTILPNETYVYRLRPADSTLKFDSINSGFIAIEVSNDAPPPKIPNVTGEFVSQSVNLSWSIELVNNFYSSYQIEMSDNALTWKIVNELPFVPLQKTEKSHLVFYQAHFPQNNRPYFFRVRGRTPFATLGPVSDPVQGMGLDPKLVTSPSISSVLPLPEGGFNISWTFGEEHKINNFQVFRSDDDLGVYEPISDKLSPETRNFQDPDPMRSNYYRVTVYDQYDREMSSYSALAQPEDSTPPATPTSLRGLILDDGQVIINWDKNTEDDFMGYRIWLSNQPDADYSLETRAPINNNFYIGHTTLNTLSRELFVKISALDYRQNPSPLSDYVVLVRPDTIPPSPPLMTNVEATEESLLIEWAMSETSDVRMHEFYRRPLGDSTWQLLKTYQMPEELEVKSYKETDLEVGKHYEYRMDAIDWSDLRSSSKIMQGCIIDDFIRTEIERLAVTADRREHTVTVNWTYSADTDNFHHFEVYRATEGKTPRIIESILPTEANEEIGRRRNSYSFTDSNNLRMNTDYVYHVRAVYSDGAQSPLSDGASVGY